MDEISLIDGHLHPPFAAAETYPFARYFTEAADTAIVSRHAPQTLFYRRAIRDLAELLDCAPDAEAVQEARRALAPRNYLHLLAREANVHTLLIDDGYPPEGATSLEVIAEQSGCTARRILRLETLAESLMPGASGAVDLANQLIAALDAHPEAVALKTIVAYRSGLQIAPVGHAEAERAFAEVRAASGWIAPRLTSKPLLDFLLLRALEWAVENLVPVQFHTGYGDRDIDLSLANPALLRPLLEDRRFAELTVVLLHAAYPYSREAAYLASVYPGVYVDWSEVNPMLPAGELRRVVEELLALAPFTKLLYGSDAWGIPDWIYLAARAGRAALWAALAQEPDCIEIARRILRENALDLYQLRT